MAAAVLGPLPATKLRNATRVGEDGPVQGPARFPRKRMSYAIGVYPPAASALQAWLPI